MKALPPKQKMVYNSIKAECLKTISEKFERISTKINMLWGNPECEQYLRSLAVNDRPDPRQGFPFGVLNSIMVLANMHAELFGSNLTITLGKVEQDKPRDIWSYTVFSNK
ncbi:MAG: hypothetical protein QXN55_00240 [Candidatus Nitrosotenuis sp.]